MGPMGQESNTHCDMKDKPCLAACEAEYRICTDACP